MNGWLDKMFERCKKKWPWLAEQPEMIPWDDGCRQLDQRLGQWLEGYSEAVCTEAVRHDHPTREKYVNRLMHCLGHHWDHAVEADLRSKVPSTTVAERIQGGRGYVKGKKLGGDPMRDVVLAVAMVDRDANAPCVFEADYRGLCTAKAAKLNTRLVRGPDDWWNDLLYYLAGYAGSGAALDKFHGKSALPEWLHLVARHFLLRWMRREWKLTRFDELHDEPRPTPLDEKPAIALAALICESLEVLTKGERQLIEWHCLLGEKRKVIASELVKHPLTGEVLKKPPHPGTLGRWLDDAIEKAAKHAVDCSPKYPDIADYEGVLEEITKDAKAYAAALRFALGENKEDQS